MSIYQKNPTAPPPYWVQVRNAHRAQVDANMRIWRTQQNMARKVEQLYARMAVEEGAQIQNKGKLQ